jgi:hypothetical protein
VNPCHDTKLVLADPVFPQKAFNLLSCHADHIIICDTLVSSLIFFIYLLTRL